jgi:ADP-dependent NAD(P)H-hydrate dehydratase / NAD(P)H-hydrate epimerase
MTDAPRVIELDAASAASLVPRRDPAGHKGTFGRVALVAGSLDYAGAALLAGSAALRGGAGLASLFVPGSLQPTLAGRVPELITRSLPELTSGEVDAVQAAAIVGAEPHDALVLGPGLVPDRSTVRLVSRLLATAGAPAVVDAGALAALATVPSWWRRFGRACVLTPHPGEFERLTGEGPTADIEREVAATAAAVRWGQVVVLKGARTVVAAPAPGATRRSPFALPLLATAGTGDVLAGLIGALLAQGLGPADAAALGVYLHGLAGEALTDRLGDAGLLASDLLVELPRARASLAGRARRPTAAAS